MNIARNYIYKNKKKKGKEVEKERKAQKKISVQLNELKYGQTKRMVERKKVKQKRTN